jgi:oligopeptide transport system ATP-binding protein
MEVAQANELYTNPQHPYTKALMSAVPIPDPMIERNKKIELLQGDLPSPINPPSGCVFRTRCPQALAHCSDHVPALQTLKQGEHQIACHLMDR